MPRLDKILTIFVASPSDVDEERLVVDETVKNINNSWSREYGLRLSKVGID